MAGSTVRVWDLPTRLFHWTLAASVMASIVTAKIGGNAAIWHFRLGYLAFTLLVFRLLWGLVGGRWSRFASFFPTPGRLLRYLRGQPRPDDHFEAGHTPLGALSVFGMLGLLVVQVATGLVADDEIANTGPLNRFAPGWLAKAATTWHKTGGQWLILALIVLHLGAIVFYRVRMGRRLVGPMLTGDRTMDAPVPPSADGAGSRLLALVLAAACAALVTYVVSLGD